MLHLDLLWSGSIKLMSLYNYILSDNKPIKGKLEANTGNLECKYYKGKG